MLDIKTDVTAEGLPEVLKSGRKFFYIKKEIEGKDILPYRNIIGLSCDIGDQSVSATGIPEELIFRTDFSHEGPEIKYEKDGDLVYFSPASYDTVDHLITIIEIFNNLPVNLKIFLSNRTAEIVSSFANENISFEVYQSSDKLNFSASILLTYGYISRKVISLKVPTIVVGPQGFGGFISPERLPFLLDDNFLGRPGSKNKEIIPREILLSEILEVKQNPEIDIILKRNLSVLMAYSGKFRNQVCRRKNSFLKKYRDLGRLNERGNLKVRLASNIRVIRKKDVLYIQRKKINDILFSVPVTEEGIIEDFRNASFCSDLQKKYKISENEFWKIVFILLERKALVLVD